MNAQLDLSLGESLRDDGLDRVEGNNSKWIELAREYAVVFCKRHDTVSADDIRDWAERMNYWPQHSNAFGALFRPKCWLFTGWKQSKHASNHARAIRVWRCLPPEDQP